MTLRMTAPDRCQEGIHIQVGKEESGERPHKGSGSDGKIPPRRVPQERNDLSISNGENEE